METAQNVASSVAATASKILYGEQQRTESGQEPASGQQGAGTTEEPFDQGNKDDATGSNDPKSIQARNETPAAPGSDPATGSDVVQAQQPEHKQQGADKPMDQPEGEQADAVKDKKDEGEAAMAKRDPNDHSGEPMHMHDSSEQKNEVTDKERAPSQPGGQKPLGGEEKGTGEKHIKTSGLAADGGDFDATKAGAGSEANRLLEQKGIRKDPAGAATSPDDTAGRNGSPDAKEKTSKVDKIKEKLHIGHKS